MYVQELVYRMAEEVERRVLPALRRRRPSLAAQLERAADSVVLNVFEGWTARGKRKASFLDVALGSARETLAVVNLAVALRIVSRVEVAQLRDYLDHICAILWKLSRR